MTHFFRILTCIGAVGLWLYGAVDNQNRTTRLRMEIPSLQKEVDALHEKNRTLLYEVEQFEDPINLLHLAKQPEFGHLRYPYREEVLVIESSER